MDAPSNPDRAAALAQLRALLDRGSADPSMEVALSSQAQVLARFQPLFTPAGIESLSAEGFRDFLLFRNNHHWSGLQRLGPAITEDMASLRAALHVLIDESKPVGRRLDRLLSAGKERVRKLGKAVLTPILFVAHPARYGVWNGTSEAAMRQLGLWPTPVRGESTGATYERVNEILLGLARDLGTDLWTLDALWWRLLNPAMSPAADPDEEPTPIQPADEDADQRFGMERHLHQFLVDNWDKTPELGKDWALCEEGGDVDGYGSERRTAVGTIDLLAKHRREKRWLVVELKRGQTSDETLGQVLRYMGWVQQHVAGPAEAVEGLIVALEADDKLRYALVHAPRVRFMRYEVSFRLVAAPPAGA